MDNIESIKEKMEKMENEQIVSVKANPLYSLVLLIAGIIFVILGILFVSGEGLKTLTITSGIIIAFVGFVYVLKNTGVNSAYYIYEPTGKKLKKYKASLEESDAKKMLSCINSNNFVAVKYMKKAINSGYLIEARGTDDGKIFLFQLLEYVPHDFVPSSPVVVLHGKDAEMMLKFVKLN
jgi:hypothetical protein